MDIKSIIKKVDHKRFVYRSLPQSNGGIIGLGSYPKGRAGDPENAVYYKEFFNVNSYSGVYLIRGKGHYRDSEGNEYPLEAGDFFHRLPCVSNWAVPQKRTGWLELFVSLPLDIWKGWLSCMPPKAELCKKWHIGIRADIVREFLEMQDELSECEISGICKISLDIQRLLLRLYNMSVQSEVSGADLIKIACSRLRNDFSRELDLHELAGELGLAYETFRRRFVRETGIPPAAYRNRLRIEKACRLLCENRYKISQIALQLGYSDGFVFSRQFKKAIGKSPSDFARLLL